MTNYQTEIKVRKESLDKLYKTMDTIGQKAEDRGLTPEILESLLNEDD